MLPRSRLYFTVPSCGTNPDAQTQCQSSFAPRFNYLRRAAFAHDRTFTTSVGLIRTRINHPLHKSSTSMLSHLAYLIGPSRGQDLVRWLRVGSTRLVRPIGYKPDTVLKGAKPADLQEK